MNNKVKVFFQAGLHGNEPASTEGILYLIDELLNNKKYDYLLDRITLAIIPMANIDGYEKNDRYAANGLDLNRDHTKLIAKESICLKQAFSNFCADVSVDFHEYTPFRKDNDCCGVTGSTWCAPGYTQSIQKNGCEKYSDSHIGTCCTPIEGYTQSNDEIKY